MNNKLVKYESSIWNKINNRLRFIFKKNKDVLSSKDLSSENHEPDNQNLDNKVDSSYQDMKNRFVFVVMELEAGRMVETDLSLDEIKMMTKYYKKEIDGLDKKLLEQDEKILRLNAYYNTIQRQNA